MQQSLTSRMKDCREEKVKELSSKTPQELKAIAKEEGVHLYSTVPTKQVQAIAETLTRRHFHGDAFRS